MDVRTGPKHRDTGAGFTLVELLLSVSLLVLLLGAIVFNFSGLQRGAELNEGVNQVEALIRFARAHASNSGHPVQLSFEEDVDDESAEPLGNLRLLWEPDPVARPGFLVPLVEAGEYVRGLTDLIRIESVRLVAGNSFEPATPGASGDASENAGDNSTVAAFPSIGFFADGSSDSAEIVIASRSEEDSRRIAVRLQGITGSIRRKLIADESKAVEPETPPQSNTVNEAKVAPAPQPD
jgi:type II secretory pathway pseudopilin PulG